MVGTTVSHYKILENLGGGGMGVVYKAQDTRLKRAVALKFLPPDLTKDPESKERFVHEAQLASSLQHSNICVVHDIDETPDGRMFIVMEYLEGETLRKKIERGRLTIEDAIDVAIQAAKGLSKAHEHGIVHRDIKPANIMVTADGTVKIVDFGLAKLAGQARLTRAGSTIGTIAYMSPEQARGEEVDHRTDIWSLGAVLYEMLTGQLPFHAEHEAAILYSILNEEPVSLRQLQPETPAGLEGVLMMTLAKSPEQRFSHMEQLAGDLRILLNSLGSNITQRLSGPSESIPSIAVLPFVDMSPEKDQEYFCDGIAEEIINALTHVEGLRVVARTSAFFFKDKHADIREIGRRLSVETVLEGSVRKAGSRLRVTAQLINVPDGYHIWSDRYDRQLDDVFAIQDEITFAIVDKLKVELLGKERVALEKRYTRDPEAYNFYLKGRYFWNQRNEQGFTKAIDHFQRAVERDPLYALAYSGLADCYNLLPWWSDVRPKDAYPKAKSAAVRSLEIDGTLAEAHTSHAFAMLFFDWDWARAEKEFNQAIQLNPNYSTAHHWYANYLLLIGQFDHCMAEIERALELDPLSLVINEDVGMFCYFARRYDQSIDALDRTMEIDKDFPYVHLYRGWALLQKGKYDDALGEFQQEKTISKGWNWLAETWIGVTQAMMGQGNAARKVLENLLERSKETYISPYMPAILYSIFGDKDQSIRCLESAAEEHDISACFIKVDPILDNLRSEPRFNILLKRMGLER